MLTLLFSLVCQVPGSVAIDPALTWYTIETGHFEIHFASHDRRRPDEESERLARRIADACEEVHAALVPYAGWTPRERTDVVVADFFDYANGWAAPVPRNTITVIPTIPAGDRVGFDDWLRTLLVHEYAHILQLDMVRGIPALLRRVFGRVIVTNPLMPTWLIEGWAVKAETDLTSSGRLGSTEYDMMLRAAADSNRLLPIDRAAHYSLELYPGGNAPYLYGGTFYRWAEQRFGDTIWQRYHRLRAGGVPYFEEPHARRVFGRPFPALWRDWQADVRRHADTVGRRLRAEGLTSLRLLTDEGWDAGSPCWSRSGQEVYYHSRDRTEYPAIKAVNLTNGATRTLHRGLVSGTMSLTPDGRRLLFSERGVWRNYYEFSDLWALELDTGRLERLTHGLRATDPDCAPDGARVVFVLNRGMTTDLAILDLRDGTVTNLTNTTEPTGHSRPRFSPDGRYIAVSINRPDGRCDIEVHDTRTGWTIPVTDDRAIDLAPDWSPGGQWLYYASDRSGVFNVYAWSPTRTSTYRCTNVLYGVFEPAVAPDNRSLAVAAFSPRGFDVAVLPLEPQDWVLTVDLDETLPAAPRAGPPASGQVLYRYSPLPSLVPALWFPAPIPESDGWTLSAMTFGWDALQLHRYALAAGWRTGGRPGPRVIADYRYAGLRPDIALETDLARDRQILGLFAGLPFRRTRSSTRLMLGVRADRREVVGLRLLSGFARSTARGYRLGVAPEEGGTIYVSPALEHRSALGRRTRVSVFHDFRHWYRLPARTSLQARLAFGIAGGDASADSAWRIAPGPAPLGVRGFADSSAQTAACILLAGIEARTPLLRVERGIGTAPFFLSNVNAAVFAEGGILSHRLLPTTGEADSARIGAGLELRADLILGHMVPAQIRAGAGIGARPYGSPPSHQFYLRIESALVAGLLDQAGIVAPD
ncbi:MAG: hypothetical protein R6X12_05670 [bacterium]